MNAILRNRVVGAVLFVGVIGALLASEGSVGFGRDEGQYMRAAERYWGWFEELGREVAAGRPTSAFRAETIDQYWSDNAPDHPVIMKTLFGLSWRAFHRCHCTGPTRGLHPIAVPGRHITLPLFPRESTAFRFPAFVMAGFLAWLVFRFSLRLIPWPAAAAAAILAVAQPHFFFHASIACFDAPITTMAFAVGFAYWKSLRSRRWGIIAGLVFGVALGVKHNAWLMPFFLVAHYLWMRRADLRARRIPPVPLAFMSMAVLGPLVFFLHWPWLWHHPVTRIAAYLHRHLQHEHYNFEYLGLNWNLPPTDWDLKLLRTTFPFVSTALTVPVTTLVLAVVGVFALARRRRGEVVITEHDSTDTRPDAAVSKSTWTRPGADRDLAPGAFLAVQTLGPVAVLAIPSTPIFGGVKHFMTAMPYLAVLAGIGIASVARAIVCILEERRARPRLTAAGALAVTTLACLPALVETRRSHPDGLSHYNMLAGGFAGGATLGMNRQFWAYCVLPMLDWVNQRKSAHASMYWHDVIGDAIAMYKREGRLALSVGDTGFGDPGVARSTMGIIVWEKHWALYEKFIWDHYGTLRPTFVRDREGVPLVITYERNPEGPAP